MNSPPSNPWHLSSFSSLPFDADNQKSEGTAMKDGSSSIIEISDSLTASTRVTASWHRRYDPTSGVSCDLIAMTPFDSLRLAFPSPTSALSSALSSSAPSSSLSSHSGSDQPKIGT